MLLKRSVSLLLCAALGLWLCLFALPGTTRAATATEVKLSPADTDVVTLSDGMPYLVNNAAASGGVLGEGGCTAYYHGNTLEIQGLDLTGAGIVNGSVYSSLYADGDLTIEVHGSNSVALKNRGEYPTIAGDFYARTLYVVKGSLTLSGSGALAVTAGDGYKDTSRALACGTGGARLTVGGGVTLTVTMAQQGESEIALYVASLTNDGTILAEGAGVGMHLCGITGLVSENRGSLKTTGGSAGLRLSSNHTFNVTGGTVEITSASGNPVIGKTSNPVGQRLLIGPAITSGLLGASQGTATVRDANFIMANAVDNAAYSYLRLPAPPSGGSSEDPLANFDPAAFYDQYIKPKEAAAANAAATPVADVPATGDAPWWAWLLELLQ